MVRTDTGRDERDRDRERQRQRQRERVYDRINYGDQKKRYK